MMWRVPSVAIGTVQPEAPLSPLVWGLTGALVKMGVSVQAFASRAVPEAADVLPKLTGRPLRYLDNWVQDCDSTLTALHRGTEDCQAAVVYGSFCEPGRSPSGGELEALCQRLSLPRLVVVDVSQLDGCRIPRRPPHAGGILLDRVQGPRSKVQWQTLLEALWDAPVLGWIDDSVPERTLVDYLTDDQSPSEELLDGLTRALMESLDVDRLTQLAKRGPWLPAPSDDRPPLPGGRQDVQVAVAYDDAFPAYSTETLELLEAAGACVRDFSPLKCERLPEGTDVVLIGTGTADRHWTELARNCCLQQSLRCFAAAGGRVYAEGSGLAYVSRQVALPDGTRIPMAGLIPGVAHRSAAPSRYEPASITTAIPSWLFGSRQELRGYRETSWSLQPTGPMLTLPRQREGRLDLVARGNVIGSRIVFHLASLPSVLQRFLAPFAPLHAVAGMAR